MEITAKFGGFLSDGAIATTLPDGEEVMLWPNTYSISYSWLLGNGKAEGLILMTGLPSTDRRPPETITVQVEHPDDVVEALRAELMDSTWYVQDGE